MSQFVESIKFQNGVHHNLIYHQARLQRTLQQFFPESERILLSEVFIQHSTPENNGLYKCRVVYSNHVEEVVYEPYHPKIINRYYLAVCPDEFNYSFKTTNRQFFEEARKRLKDDEDYIYIQKGYITDTSFANLVFSDGVNFYTPAHTLLGGTKREFYIQQDIVRVEEIKVKDILRFKKLHAINAMVDLEESKPYPCDKLLLSHNHLKL